LKYQELKEDSSASLGFEVIWGESREDSKSFGGFGEGLRVLRLGVGFWSVRFKVRVRSPIRDSVRIGLGLGLGVPQMDSN
jgi:hypothetical protein